jgi:Ca2+-binding RTX toxin-like protein
MSAAELSSGPRNSRLRGTLMALVGTAVAVACAAPAASAAPTRGNITNPNLNVIPSLATAGSTSGPANRYPSNNRVRLLYPNITKATVTFESLSHTAPGDIDALLVGPHGQTVLLMSDAGGPSDISRVRLTFDDSAATSLPNSTQITSGTFRPTNYGSPDPFPAPAPTGSPPGVFGSSLSTFNGTNPNGNWRLFINDDAGADVGQLDRWTLHLRASPRAGACSNSLTGTTGADRINGAFGGDRIRGRGGDDRLSGRSGRDCLSGGSGDDRISGGSGRDRISGGSGSDRIRGNSGNDRISAKDGTRDRVNCGSGAHDRARVDRRDVVSGCETVLH